MSMRKFIPLTKVDESTHSVYGVVTAETPDKEGEICDYEAAKAAYATWSAEFEKSTSAAGQELSYGNIRLQHTITPGGKVTDPVVFDDDSKSILLKSTPIDDDVWEKLKKGFYTGYSQGGDYAWRKCNECETAMPSGSRCPSCKKSVQVRYAPVIAEVSYVDNPCHGDAHFELVKTDGTKEIRKFAPKGNPMDKQTETAGSGTQMTLSAADIARITKDAADQALQQLRKSEAKTKRVAGEDLPASAFAYVGDPEKTETWKLPIKFSDEEKTKRHIRNALSRFDQTKGIPADEKPKVKAKIEAAAKKHGIEVSDEAEKAEKVARACEEIVKSVAARMNIDLAKMTGDASALGLKKGMYELSWFAQILCDLYYLHNSSVFEAEMEGDDSTMPEELLELLEAAAEKFLAMASEEVSELTAASAEFHKAKGGPTVNKEDNLSKAASAKAHIAKMRKAVSDHKDKMCKAHADHEADMQDHFAKLHKILGVEEADADEGSKSGTNEPEPIKPEGGAAKTYTQADLDKAVAEAATKGADEAAKAIIKALKGDDDEDGDGDGADGKDGKDGKPKKAAAAAGVGDRTQMPVVVSGAGPVVKVMPVRKEDDSRPAAAASTSTAVDADTVRKAMSGDPDARLAFMKSAAPQDGVPVTLSGALGKIKH